MEEAVSSNTYAWSQKVGMSIGCFCAGAEQTPGGKHSDVPSSLSIYVIAVCSLPWC
jgi:hypothetical protein